MSDGIYTHRGRQDLSASATTETPKRSGVGLWAFLCLAAVMFGMTVAGLFQRRKRKEEAAYE